MKTATLKYPSADGKTAIRALLWKPDAAEQPEGSETPERLRYSDVRGIVQVVHGMSEHVVRYAHFAKFLVESGFVVCARAITWGMEKAFPTRKTWAICPLAMALRFLIEMCTPCAALCRRVSVARCPM